MRFKDKVVLITGAATGSRAQLMGFGGAVAWMFAEEGARVVMTDINNELGERSAQEIQAAGGNAVYHPLDVTQEQDWHRVMKALNDECGRLNILVNNAGTGVRENVEDTTTALWDNQMAVHAKGAFLGTRAAIPLMRKVGGGSIINISSIYGIIGSPTSTAYHAAKGAIRTFTKAAAIQYAKENIRVNSIHPGYAETPLTREGFASPERRKWLLERIPLGRLGTAQDIAKGIVYLASDDASFITGSELVIDGGTTAQ